MAYTNKISANATAFKDNLKADLVAAGWVLGWSNITTYVDSGTAQTLPMEEYAYQSPTGVIFTFRYYAPNINGLSYISYAGATAINLAAGSFIQHAGISPAFNLPLDGAIASEYWLSITNERVNLAYKIANTYLMGMCGKFLPFALPTEYPYPLVVGGMTPTIKDWRLPFDTVIESAGTTYAYFMNTSGVWQGLQSGFTTTSGSVYSIGYRGGKTFSNSDYSNYAFDRTRFHGYLERCLGGGHHISRLILRYTPPQYSYTQGAMYGALDGFMKVAGINQVPENHLVFGGLNYITIQSGLNTTANDYWAMEKV